MQNDDFEWDDAKAARNWREHGVSFETARRVFNDVFAFDREDRRERYGENRYAIVGRIRIVSARPASTFERRLYHEHNTQK
jgi:uncharacterized DUF497 family protein